MGESPFERSNAYAFFDPTQWSDTPPEAVCFVSRFSDHTFNPCCRPTRASVRAGLYEPPQPPPGASAPRFAFAVVRVFAAVVVRGAVAASRACSTLIPSALKYSW